MDPAHIVLLLAVTIAIVAIAGYLIAIVLILKHVVGRLTTILGAVQAVTDTSQPVGEIVEDINRDLDAGRKLIEDAVGRLEASRVPVGAASAQSSRHGVEGQAPGGPGGGTATATERPASAPAGTEPVRLSTNAESSNPEPDGRGSEPDPRDAEPDRQRSEPDPRDAEPDPRDAEPDRREAEPDRRGFEPDRREPDPPETAPRGRGWWNR